MNPEEIARLASEVRQTAIYRHAVRMYEIMAERSFSTKYGERAFSGKLKDVFEETGASKAYYTPIRQLLDSPDLDPCITVLERGNASQRTLIRLNHPPPPEWGVIAPKDLTAPAIGATMIVDLAARVERLEAWRETLGGVNLAEALRNFESRISRLEGERENGET
jgi:hypothetical protein